MIDRPERQFYFRLAGFLKAPSVAVMLRNISSLEIAEWMAFERITGPLDERHRMDIAAGTVASTVANAGGAKMRIRDFMPQWFKRKKTPEELWQEVLRMNAQMGGRLHDNTSEPDS